MAKTKYKPDTFPLLAEKYARDGLNDHQIACNLGISTATFYAYQNKYREFEEAVKRHIQNGAKIVVFGHTHKPQLERIANGIYANCGTWVDKETPTYIFIDGDKIEIIE